MYIKLVNKLSAKYYKKKLKKPAKKACERYENLSEEEKEKKRQYGTTNNIKTIVPFPIFAGGGKDFQKNTAWGMSNFPLPGGNNKNLGESFARGCLNKSGLIQFFDL